MMVDFEIDSGIGNPGVIEEPACCFEEAVSIGLGKKAPRLRVCVRVCVLCVCVRVCECVCARAIFTLPTPNRLKVTQWSSGKLYRQISVFLWMKIRLLTIEHKVEY